MNKKIFIQSFLVLIIMFTSFVFYKLFLADNVLKVKNIKLENLNISEKNTNQINDIIYRSKSIDDNNYIVKAEFAQINADNPDFMLLTNVKGKFLLKNSEIIEITSKKANYNSVNYNTNFYNEVLVVYENNQINSNNFDLFFDKKIGTIYGDVIYKNLNTTLEADKIDIDLITKDSKIYMLNKSKKIKIKNLK